MDISTSAGAIAFFQTTGYPVLFLLMMVEGPFFTFAAAFAASMGFSSFFLILFLSFSANIIGDFILFFIGRHAGKRLIKRFVRRPSRLAELKRIESHLKDHPGKMIAIVKNTPAIPIPGILMISAMGMPFRTYALYACPNSLARSLLFALLGYFAGTAFGTIATYAGYTNYVIGAAVLLFVIIWFVMRFVARKISVKLENS